MRARLGKQAFLFGSSRNVCAMSAVLLLALDKNMMFRGNLPTSSKIHDGKSKVLSADARNLINACTMQDEYTFVV